MKEESSHVLLSSPIVVHLKAGTCLFSHISIVSFPDELLSVGSRRRCSGGQITGHAMPLHSSPVKSKAQKRHHYSHWRASHCETSRGPNEIIEFRFAPTDSCSFAGADRETKQG
jgi:hypothetical protein